MEMIDFMELYDISVEDRAYKQISLSEYKGKVLLIVNTATHWGLTPQYKDLEELYRRYKDEGFEILDFPCNQFKNQAPGTNEDIYRFVQENYATTFKMFSKLDVNGKDESPLYTWLKSKKKSILGKNINWNFTKFLVRRDGEVIERYEPKTEPFDIEADIKEQLEI